jgi:hypothetical protein
MENYSVTIENRTKDMKAVRDDEGNNRSTLSFDVNINEGSEESYLNQLAKTLKTWLPDNQTSIELSVFNSISGTYMKMYSFYINENRFIEH